MRISVWSADVFSSDLRNEAARLLARLGDTQQNRAPHGGLAVLRQLGVIFHHLQIIELFGRQQRRVPAVGDLDLLQHLANDHLDMLVVDLHALQTINFLRSEEHTSELQSLMRISYAVFCLKKKKN